MSKRSKTVEMVAVCENTFHRALVRRPYITYSFRRRGMERPAGSRHSCAVTRGLQTTP